MTHPTTSTSRFPPHKAGDTFHYAGLCQLPAGLWSASAQVRSTADNSLIATLDVSLGAPTPEGTPLVLYAAAADTAAWAIGVHQVDVRYADSLGNVLHTSTLLLPVVRAVTV